MIELFKLKTIFLHQLYQTIDIWSIKTKSLQIIKSK